MKLKVNIRREIKVIAAMTGLSFLIAFTERQHDDMVCKNIVIEIENTQDNHFVDEADVMGIIGSTGTSIIGTSLSRINLRAIEAKLKSDRHIATAELYGDFTGNLIVNVSLRRPIARIVRSSGPDAYIAEDGSVMRTSEKFSSRVVLISGNFANELAEMESLRDSEDGAELLQMIHFISGSEFWRAQIAQIDFDQAHRILIYPQVTGQLVEFGSIQNYQEKLRKLMIFYKEILPQRGWTKYERVNVEYAEQVIAE